VHNFAMSVDGYCAGPNQTLEQPLGAGGEDLHQWMFVTPTWKRMTGQDIGPDDVGGIDDDYVAAGDENVGAHVMGRNMFGPVRGDWPDDEWRGWWGPNPPYHHDVFVLTHFPRPSVEMEGGTTFHFVTDGVEAALERAFDAAGGKDVRLGGGVSVVQQCMRAGLVDRIHCPVSPVLLGGGERLFADGVADRYELVEFVPSDGVTHVTLAKRV
jgi:dihydrofolate reductase